MQGQIAFLLLIVIFHHSISSVTKAQLVGGLRLFPYPRRISSETGSHVLENYPVFGPWSHRQKAFKNVEFRTDNPDEGTYHFGYQTDNLYGRSFREEIRDSSGRVRGRYGYLDPTGIPRAYEYMADSRGFRTWALDVEDEMETSTVAVTTIKPSPVTVQTEMPLFQYNPKNLQLIGPIPRPWNDMDDEK